MRIDNFIRIIDGQLANKPPIDAFASLCFDVPRLAHGDLFIDTTASRELIHQAIEKGAYAVVTTLPFLNDDDECAWICVDEIERTLIKLLRYSITQKSLEIILLNPIQASFLEMLQTTPKTIKRLRGDLQSITKTILHAKEEERFCLENEALVQKIAPIALTISRDLNAHPNIIQKGLFLSSFCYQKNMYHEQKIPSLFVEDLISLLTFCDEQEIAYSLDQLSFGDHFSPQFVSHSLRKKEFGTSDKVLIFEPDLHLLPRIMTYLGSYADASKMLLCLPQGLHYSYPFEGKRLEFSSLDILHERLLEQTFSHAVILGDKSDFEGLFTKHMAQQLSLF